jgi:protein TonB
VTSIALPPLDCSETRPSLGERLGNGAVVVALHLLLGYAALYLSVKNDLIQLPPSISVRLLPMMEEKKVEPPKPLPPPPKPVRRPQPVQAQPVLAVTSKEPSPSSFAVAPQPPAPHGAADCRAPGASRSALLPSWLRGLMRIICITPNRFIPRFLVEMPRRAKFY